MLSSFYKKARLFRAYVSRHPMWCAWQVTYRCNFRCQFCGYWEDPLAQQPDEPVSQYALGARKLAGFGSMLVSLAGGEPFIRQDLPELINVVAQHHFPFVTTNGSLVTPAVAEAVMSAGLWGVSISIDYADPAKHDAARGREGAWEQAFKAVEYFSAARKHAYQRVNVMGVLLDDNLDQIESLIQMAAKRDAYFMVQPYGHRKTGSQDFVHTPDVSAPLGKLRKAYPNFLSNPVYLSKFDEYLRGGIPGCMAGRAFYNIDSRGDIAICVENKDRPVANLFRDSRYVIAKRLKQAAQNNPCTDCWYNCRGEVESLYHPISLVKSLPTFIFDRGSLRDPHHSRRDETANNAGDESPDIM